MADDLLIRLNPPAVARLRALMQHYGDTRPEAMVSRALGLLELLRAYVSEDGILTIVDPHVKAPAGDEAFVDFQFENMKQRPAKVLAEG